MLRRDIDERIWSANLYKNSGYDVFVPVVPVEAALLARYYPLVWRRTTSGFELGALLFLTQGFGPARRARLESAGLPLLVECYPFSARRGGNEAAPVLIDAPPEGETGTGTSVFRPDGTPADGSMRQLNALQVFMSDSGRGQAFTDALAAGGLLEGWPVQLKVGDAVASVDGLAILTRDGDARRRRLGAVLEQHGVALAELVTLHDLSLFNMQKLVDFMRTEQLFARAVVPA